MWTRHLFSIKTTVFARALYGMGCWRICSTIWTMAPTAAAGWSNWMLWPLLSAINCWLCVEPHATKGGFVGGFFAFVANRIQLALFHEALACVEDGLASPEQVDEVVYTSFGFRLPFFGPFQSAGWASVSLCRRSWRHRWSRAATALKPALGSSTVVLKQEANTEAYNCPSSH